MLLWNDEAWEDYIYWQIQYKKTLKRINLLIKDIQRNYFTGIGKPEPLMFLMIYYKRGFLCTQQLKIIVRMRIQTVCS